MNEFQMLDLLRLQDHCESYDDIELKLNWETLKARSTEDGLDFFHYEEEQLVGFLGIYHFGEEYEICGMVHPDYRCRGIFTRLFEQAIATIPDKCPLLINAPQSSQSAHKWLEKRTCEYNFSEYQMKWEPMSFPSDARGDVTLRLANEEDIAFLIKVDEECFGFEQTDLDLLRQSILANEENCTYILEANRNAIGKVQVIRMNGQSFVYGFAILSMYQGKGYGKSSLMQTIQVENEVGNEIFIEVALHNRNALHLYEQCGFVPYQIQDYYAYKW